MKSMVQHQLSVIAPLIYGSVSVLHVVDFLQAVSVFSSVCGVSSVQPCMGYLQRVCPEVCVVWELTLEKILHHHLPVTAFPPDDHKPHSPAVKARKMIDKLVPTCLKVAPTFKSLHWSRTSSEFITCFDSKP